MMCTVFWDRYGILFTVKTLTPNQNTGKGRFSVVFCSIMAPHYIVRTLSHYADITLSLLQWLIQHDTYTKNFKPIQF